MSRPPGAHRTSLNSPRLKRALKWLEGHKFLTGWEWAVGAGFLNPGTVASELNATLERAGDRRRVRCMFYETRDDGSKVFRYWVVKTEAA
jgi:hypothetical protein